MKIESQVGWVVRGAILVRAWDGFVQVQILQGAFSTFFKFYQTFRACNFFQHILANSGFSLWYLAHFKELPELRLTTCSHLLIFHFYYIKMIKNGQFFEVFLSFSMARTTFNQLQHIYMKKVYIQRQKMLTFLKLVSDFSEGVWASVQRSSFSLHDNFSWYNSSLG